MIRRTARSSAPAVDPAMIPMSFFLLFFFLLFVDGERGEEAMNGISDGEASGV